jgi:hypothetical protein
MDALSGTRGWPESPSTVAGGSPHVKVLDRYARDAEEPGPAPVGELAHSFRIPGILSMGVAHVLRLPRVRAPAPWAGSLPSRHARMASEGFTGRSKWLCPHAATPCKDLGAKRRPRAGLDGEARPTVCGIREALGHQLVYVVVVTVVQARDLALLHAGGVMASPRKPRRRRHRRGS